MNRQHAEGLEVARVERTDADEPGVPPVAGVPNEGLKDEEYYQASQRRLVWRRFKKHRVALVALFGLVAMYVVAMFAEFFAPYALDTRFEGASAQAPTSIRIIHDGQLHRPFVYGTTRVLSLKTFRYTYVEDKSRPYPIRLFGKGDTYELWGVVEGDRHLEGRPRRRVALQRHQVPRGA